ncbi:zinc-dependent metalloprotease [Oerskovia flava]|uniref:zinc-dependent metalloprotease n=1 Tax=Oerskovia flava TaxID=2986422 RepID=UPI00224057D1|nr:zinc-dependent metalloprotease [Oerskovia sp. JB1-3-2]
MTLTDAAPTPLVDWSAAAQIAGRLARPGPAASRTELDDLVADLHAVASAAVPHVLRVTRMRVAPGPGADPGGPTSLGPVYVVDRVRWARANTEIMAAMTAGLPGDHQAEARGRRPRVSQATALTGAAQVGAVLAALSSRVLGQFDPYSAPESPGAGRLLLVAPNVLHVERELELVPSDFRLWVALHEQTHALQFSAAPWLADHLRARATSLLADVTESSRRLTEARLRDRLTVAGRAVLGAVRGDGSSLLDGVLSPEQRHAVEEVSAVMALLEGHADVAMDAVGPRTVRTVRQIRARFERRRDGAGSGTFDAVLRRLLGMDAKIAQYRDGAAFVRAVEKDVGRDGFNAVWAAPENLPTSREIADARAWVRRVHG